MIQEGVFRADGGPSEILFTSSADEPSPGDWDGIFVGANSSLLMDSCTVQYAHTGVRLWNQYPVCAFINDTKFRDSEYTHIHIEGNVGTAIRNCDFLVNCPVGIQIEWGTSAEWVQIDRCTITGTAEAFSGVFVNYGSPRLMKNNISGFTAGTGIYVTGYGSPVVDGDTLSTCKWGISSDESSAPGVAEEPEPLQIENCTVGILTQDSAAPELTSPKVISGCIRGLYAKYTSAPYIRNTIFDNCTLYAVEATSQAEPDLGTVSEPGLNSFISSAGCGTYRHVKAKLRYPGVGPVMAEKNWWGSDPPNAGCFSAGTVDYDPWLSSDPNEAGSAEMVHAVLEGIPAAVGQNYPNPFRDITKISYAVPVGGTRVKVDVFDVKGRLVRVLIDQPHEAGRYKLGWDGLDSRGRAVASGIYFLRVEIGDDFKETKKMILGR